MNCGKCHHFDRFEINAPDGACIAHPPIASIIMVPGGPNGFHPENFTAFPMVNATQTCGEWRLSDKTRLVLLN